MLKLIFKYAKKYWWQIGLLLIITGLSAKINLELPQYTSKIINEGVAKADMDAIYASGFQMLGLALLGGVTMIVSIFLASRIAGALARDIRLDTFRHIEDFSMNEFGKFSVASLITRTTNDAQQFQQTMSMIMRMGFYAPFIGIGAVLNVVNLSGQMSWVVAACVTAILLMVMIITIFAMPKFKIIQKIVDKLNLQTRQTITGLRVIRAYGNDKVEEEKFAKINDENYKVNIFVGRIMSLISPFMTMISGFSMVAIVWLGSYLIHENSLQIGDVFALIQYVAQTTMAFMMLSMVFILAPRMAVSLGRIKDVLDVEVSIHDPKNPIDPPTDNSLEFKNVGFKYGGSEDNVLNNVSFKVNSGETIAVIGGTGSGKSTIAKLIPRFYDITSGKILIGGVDISQITQHDLRNLIAYVPQKSALLSGTIHSNIVYGSEKKLTDDEIKTALKTAQAWDFVNKLPKKLEAHVAQSGRNFSGGQKQRLSIARALAKNAPILIFDDSFSALDFKTDAKLRAELAKTTPNQTKFIVAQRVSSIVHADKIVVMDGGKIAGLGTHEELLRSNKVYQEIASSQLSEDELKSPKAKKISKKGAK